MSLQPLRTRIKVCGITRAEDGAAAAAAGADAIGLVFYAASPRAISVAQATALVAALPPLVTRVGLFVNPDPVWVREVLAAVALDLLQFHGDESAELCRAFGRPYLKALRMRPDCDIGAQMHAYGDASGILLDAWHPAAYGGTGESFDWQLIPNQRPRPLLLAGGLDPDNVAAAVSAVRPYAVDVSSGVEQRPGIKDAARIDAFAAAVARADSLI